MKKQFFWLALGASALTACTSTDVIEEGIQSNAIGFENVVTKASRAEGDTKPAGPVSGDVDNTNFDKFVVYGYYTKDGMEAHPIQVFDGVEVSKGESGWTYKGTRYWNVASTYHFYAYSCADIALSTEMGQASMNLAATDEEGRALRINDYKCNATHQHDLICDDAEGVKAAATGTKNDNVKFQFKHALCKVSVEFANDFPEMYDIYLTNVKLVNFYDQADLLIHDGKLDWSDQERVDATPSIDMKLIGDSNKATSTQKYGDAAVKVAYNPVFMLPVAYGDRNVTFEFTLEVKQGEDSFLERTIKGSFKPDWQVGNQYKYLIHITGSTALLDEITFDAEYQVSDITDPTGWKFEQNTDMTFSM